MDVKDFKKEFGQIAKVSGFDRAYSGWFKEGEEAITVLELQKSNFGTYYQLNIKVFVQGVFGENYTKTKDVVKSSVGHINSGETQKYKKFLDLDQEMNSCLRLDGLKEMFENRMVSFVVKAITKEGIKKLQEKEELFLLPFFPPIRIE